MGRTQCRGLAPCGNMLPGLEWGRQGGGNVEGAAGWFQGLICVSACAGGEGVSSVKQSLGFPSCSCFLGAGDQRALKWADCIEICINTIL